jgi:putative ABC transport system ATP-binding protein
MYEISGLTKVYDGKGKGGKVHALQGVDVVIPDNDMLAIQGPTGHGKSTLLQLLGGLDRPTGGSLKFNDQELAKMGEMQLTKLRAQNFGYIFQSFNLIPTLTAQENVETALVPLGIPAARWVSVIGSGICRRSCPAASSSVSRSPGPWSRSPR